MRSERSIQIKGLMGKGTTPTNIEVITLVTIVWSKNLQVFVIAGLNDKVSYKYAEGDKLYYIIKRVKLSHSITVTNIILRFDWSHSISALKQKRKLNASHSFL